MGLPSFLGLGLPRIFFFFCFLSDVVDALSISASTSVVVALGLVLQRDDDENLMEVRKDETSVCCDVSGPDVLGFGIREGNGGFVERKAVTAEQ